MWWGRKGVSLIVGLSIFSLFVFSVNAESLLPSWIKTIAGFWANDQISDEEFVGALQFLVKEGILVIPSEEPQIDPPSLELDSGPSDSTTPSPISQKLSPSIEALLLQGIIRTDILVIVTLADQQGNLIQSNGDLTLKFFNEDDDELYSEKKQITTNSFKDYTNEISAETLSGIKNTIGTGKLRLPNWENGW